MQNKRNFIATKGRRLVRLLNPLAWVAGLRRSLTPASVTLILIGIVSLNIVWGYPWLGMFAACFALLVVGRTINYFASPNLIAVVNAAQSTPVDSELVVPTRLINQGRWPAMDLILEQTKRCSFVAPGGEILIMPTMQFRRRGQHPLPMVLVDSYFPFHIFRNRQWVDANTNIVATPRRLTAKDDTEWQKLEQTLKAIASHTASGDQVHYIGSREYREGVPVRRWGLFVVGPFGKADSSGVQHTGGQVGTNRGRSATPTFGPSLGHWCFGLATDESHAIQNPETQVAPGRQAERRSVRRRNV